MIDLYPPVTARFSNYTFKKCSRVLSIGLWNLRAERSMKLYARKDGRSARFESPRKSEGGCFTTVARKKCQRKASQEHSERKKKKKKLRSLFKPGGRASPIEFRLFPLFFNFWLQKSIVWGKKIVFKEASEHLCITKSSRKNSLGTQKFHLLCTK